MAELEFIRKPYANPEKTLSVDELNNMLSAGISIYGLYFLCVDYCGRHALEIIEGAELVKDVYKSKRFRILGVANGKSAAFELLRRIVEEFVATGGVFNGFREYLLALEEGGDVS